MTHLSRPLSQTWDLDSLFPGQSTSPQLHAFIEQLQSEVVKLAEQIKQCTGPQSLEETRQLDDFIERLQSAESRSIELMSYVECLVAQSTEDAQAVQLLDAYYSLSAELQSVGTVFESVLRMTPDDVFKLWIEREEIAPIAFSLHEMRELASQKLPPEQESLILDLAVDGYHGWSGHYDTIVSKIGIDWQEEDGRTVTLSAGQAANKLDHQDRAVREEMAVKWEQAWKSSSAYSADTLNRIAGFRLKLYGKRGWDDVLQEPLSINRMSRETLDTMWQVINEKKHIFVSYLQRKAQLLGLEKLSWTDVDAPLGQVVGNISYDEAAEQIVEHFRNFSPKLADFATHAFNNHWIEAEDRPGKRPGGFCTSLPVSKQTRIFMTYGGSASNVSTLAHELGHAYHQYVMDGLPSFSQNYAMNVAETASTFAELILSDALVSNAEDEEVKIALLNDKINSSIAFFMNIQARFLFETRFYEQRKKGLLSGEDLCDLMETAQKEAYCDTLATYHPHFWASKLHFYSTGVPFYNFPYTFGYLFSSGLYARAQKEGPAFAEKYDALLQDTGRMTVEQLAAKHLNVDLTAPDFWLEAIAPAIADVELFLAMTQNKVN